MRYEAKGFGKGKQRTDVRVTRGELKLQAEDEYDAALVTAIYGAIRDVRNADSATVKNAFDRWLASRRARLI